MRAIILRHAERPKLPSELGIRPQGSEEDAAPITAAGKIAALEVGSHLKGTIQGILASPVRRCVETAACLARGADLAESQVSLASFLSSDFFGSFSDLDEDSKQEAIKELLAGQVVPGFKDPKEQCRQILRLIEDSAKADPVLCVTHDWWMALLLANTTSAFVEHGFAIWPQFLESLEVCLKSGYILYRNQTFKIEL